MRFTTKPIRVLHIITDTITGAGPGNSLLTLLKHLDRSAFANWVALREHGPLAEALDGLGVPYMILGISRPDGLTYLKFLTQIVRAVARLVWFIRSQGIDLVHVHQITAPWGGLAATLASVPLVWHGRYIFEHPSFSQWLATKLTLSLSDEVIAISQATERWLTDFGGLGHRACIQVVYDAVELDDFAPSISGDHLRTSWSIPQSAPVVVMVSKLVREKGHLSFVTACDLVRREFVDVRFLIVGGTLEGHRAYAAEVRARVRELGLGQQVIFTGHRDDVPAVLSLADVFVHPPIFPEAFGRVLIEAMAMAKTVVASRVGGIPEIVVDGETGFLVPAADSEALACRVLDLLRDPVLRDQFGWAGRRRVEALFNAETHSRAVEQVYWDVLGGERQSPLSASRR